MENSIFIEFPEAEEEELHINNFGRSFTKPGHRYGPAVRSFYLIHFILEGEGKFMVNNVTYHLKKGQGFLIEPDYLTTYTADLRRPWAYVWLGFSGRKAKDILNTVGLSQDSPIFTCAPEQHLEQYIIDMLEHNYGTTSDLYRREAMLLLFSYLSTLFKKYTGLSPIKYLQTFRMTRAAHLLSLTQLPITAIAYSCGYQETESFHKIFKQHTGLSPKRYRIQEQAKTAINRENLSF